MFSLPCNSDSEYEHFMKFFSGKIREYNVQVHFISLEQRNRTNSNSYSKFSTFRTYLDGHRRYSIFLIIFYLEIQRMA